MHPKAVVVLAGARDYYQLPLALYEGGLLERLVTDMYWPGDKKWFNRSLAALIGDDKLLARYCPKLASNKVKTSKLALGAFAFMKMSPGLNLNRTIGKALSRKARLLAIRTGAPLFSYSYYAFEAFKQSRKSLKHRFIFHLHPHARSVRDLLLEEIERVPEGKSSLSSEYELALPRKEFEELSSEADFANGWVVASTYTAKTLAEHGIPFKDIHIVPYGVDSGAFFKRTCPPHSQDPFTVCFVGRLIQRKGLSYLLDAVSMLKSQNIRVLLCGRGMIDETLINSYPDLDLTVKIGLTTQKLISEIHKSDVFVLPSLAEGFAHVILEAMSCGLPVIATNHTCAPDVMRDHIDGFIVPIRNAEAIAEKLAWCMDNRADLAGMGEQAAGQASLFTWKRFRLGMREAYTQMLTSIG